jgi:hypothetical protein
MGRARSTHGEKMNSYRILVGEPEGKRPLERQRRRLEDNIKMDLREIGWGGMDWINLAQDRNQWTALANTVMNIRGGWTTPIVVRLKNMVMGHTGTRMTVLARTSSNLPDSDPT